MQLQTNTNYRSKTYL